MSTQAQILTSLRARLDEPTTVYWTDVDLRTWINEIAADIARTTESLRASETFAGVAGTGSYTPTFTLTPQRIYRVTYKPTGSNSTYPLTFRDPNAMDEVWGTLQSTQGTPSFWTSWGYPPALTIQLFPVPSVSGTVTCFFYRKSTVLATDGSAAASTVDIPAGWEDVLVDGAEYKALRRDSDPRWTEAKQLYDMGKAGLMESALRFTDAQPVITSQFGTSVPMWLYGGYDD